MAAKTRPVPPGLELVEARHIDNLTDAMHASNRLATQANELKRQDIDERRKENELRREENELLRTIAASVAEIPQMRRDMNDLIEAIARRGTNGHAIAEEG